MITLDQIHLAPMLPVWALAVIAALALGASGIALIRRARGAWWRLAASLLALTYLAGPQKEVRTGTKLPAIAVLAVDRSGSMQVADRASLAEQAARSLTQQAADRADLQLRRVDVGEAGTDGTQLFAAINAALADIPPAQRAGVIAVTDGSVTDPPKRFALPLHALITAKAEQQDRRLRVVQAPGYGIVGQSVQVGFVVEDLGASSGGTAQLSWSQDGADQGTQDVTVGEPASITVPISHGGKTVIALSVSALPGEASLLNNRVALTINGVRDRLRVLLISGQPHPGERTWRRLLKADPAVDLVHFTILRPPGKDDLTPVSQLALIPFPTRALFVEKIRQFDLIILDRFSEQGLLPRSYLENIADYVRGGGALLVSAGPEFADASSIANGPIGAVLPAGPADEQAVATGGFRPVVTPLGERHPVTEALPGDGSAGGAPHWGQWYRHVLVGGTVGDTVMRAGPDGAPLLVLSHVNDGRVALLLSDQIWLWSRGHQGGGPQAELLRRVAHWLMKEPELDETALTATPAGGRLLIERHAVKQAEPGAKLTVTDPNGVQTEAALVEDQGRQTASVPATLPGEWTVRFGTQTAYAAVPAGDPVEYEDLRATAKLLRPIAASVHFLAPDGAPDLARLKLSGAGAMRLTGLSHVNLAPDWAMLPLFLITLLAGWWRESR